MCRLLMKKKNPQNLLNKQNGDKLCNLNLNNQGRCTYNGITKKSFIDKKGCKLNLEFIFLPSLLDLYFFPN